MAGAGNGPGVYARGRAGDNRRSPEATFYLDARWKKVKEEARNNKGRRRRSQV